MLTEIEVKKIAKLAKLELTDTEIKKFQLQLSEILDYVNMVQNIDTTDVAPTFQTTIGDENRFNEDTNQNSNSINKDDALKNAPLKNEKYFKTKAVL
jgi:aspartyl-tRNA(Asn)/glutamyl-tRNA(Gln) amidotransferase subunit C